MSKEVFDYMIEHSGGSSIDFNAMIADINRREAELAKLRAQNEVMREALKDWLEWYPVHDGKSCNNDCRVCRAKNALTRVKQMEDGK